MGRTVAVVPALNEEGSIAAVVRAAAAHVDHVVVIDDGSTDRTAELARGAGAAVISHGVNRGVGAAIASGLAWAIDADAAAVVQLDGDGQHDARFARAVLAKLDDGCDLCIGTRFEHGFEMGLTRRTAMRLFAAIISRRVGVRISDPTSGFRGFSRRACEVLQPRFPVTYLSDTVEVLYIAAEQGLRVATVPVEMHPRVVGKPSVGPIRSAGYALRMLTIVVSHSLRRRSSR